MDTLNQFVQNLVQQLQQDPHRIVCSLQFKQFLIAVLCELYSKSVVIYGNAGDYVHYIDISLVSFNSTLSDMGHSVKCIIIDDDESAVAANVLGGKYVSQQQVIVVNFTSSSLSLQSRLLYIDEPISRSVQLYSPTGADQQSPQLQLKSDCDVDVAYSHYMSLLVNLHNSARDTSAVNKMSKMIKMVQNIKELGLYFQAVLALEYINTLKRSVPKIHLKRSHGDENGGFQLVAIPQMVEFSHQQLGNSGGSVDQLMLFKTALPELKSFQSINDLDRRLISDKVFSLLNVLQSFIKDRVEMKQSAVITVNENIDTSKGPPRLLIAVDRKATAKLLCDFFNALKFDQIKCNYNGKNQDCNIVISTELLLSHVDLLIIFDESVNMNKFQNVISNQLCFFIKAENGNDHSSQTQSLLVEYLLQQESERLQYTRNGQLLRVDPQLYSQLFSLMGFADLSLEQSMQIVQQHCSSLSLDNYHRRQSIQPLLYNARSDLLQHQIALKLPQPSLLSTREILGGLRLNNLIAHRSAYHQAAIQIQQLEQQAKLTIKSEKKVFMDVKKVKYYRKVVAQSLHVEVDFVQYLSLNEIISGIVHGRPLIHYDVPECRWFTVIKIDQILGNEQDGDSINSRAFGLLTFAKIDAELCDFSIYIDGQVVQCSVVKDCSGKELTQLSPTQFKKILEFDLKVFTLLINSVDTQFNNVNRLSTALPTHGKKWYYVAPLSLQQIGDNDDQQRYSIDFEMIDKVCSYKASDHPLSEYVEDCTQDQYIIAQHTMNKYVSCGKSDFTQKSKLSDSLEDQSAVQTGADVNKVKKGDSVEEGEIDDQDNAEQEEDLSNVDDRTFEQYYMDKYKIKLKRPDLNLFKAHYAPGVRNLSRPKRLVQRQDEHRAYVYLPPELCCMVQFYDDVQRLFSLVPSILHKIESQLIVQEFKQKFDCSLSIEQLYPAFIAPNANEDVNYERLETLGDSYLKYIVTAILYVMQPQLDEGGLSTLRANRVSNAKLYELSVQNELPGYLIASPLNLKTWRWCGMQRAMGRDDRLLVENQLSSKMIADFFESLVGAHCNTFNDDDGGVGSVHADAVNKYLVRIGFIQQHELDSIALASQKQVSQKANNGEYGALEQQLNFEIINVSIFAEAFTHLSKNNSSVLSYQRQEFLGDAVLDWLVTKYIHDQFPTAQSSEMSDIRQVIVNNTSFARLGCQLGLHKYIRHETQQLQTDIDLFTQWLAVESNQNIHPNMMPFEAPKVLGDVFESFVGALYLNSGCNLHAVWKIIGDWVLVPFIKRHCIESDRSNLANPVRNFSEECSKLGIAQDRVKIICNESGVNQAICKIYLDNDQLCQAYSNTSAAAKRLACIQALASIKQRYAYYDQQTNYEQD
ncbi:hypothetical protein MP228_012787 [Amoeboaphelidium protococcarum]|nr:hypothetical protein MP228_012787 [Amoeboaphelidium protococcarum]